MELWTQVSNCLPAAYIDRRYLTALTEPK